MRARRAALAFALAAGACATPARWESDLPAALSRARTAGRDLVVFFALPGREASDRMQRELGDARVLAALADGGFDACVADGARHPNLFGEWIGGREGMGIAVLDGRGRCYAARPGPQDPPELAALLRACAAARVRLATLRNAVAQPAAVPLDSHALGCALLELGCRKESEALLLDAALAGIADARHRLARLYALDGNVTGARRWLANAPPTPGALVTEGYVLFKERRHREAVAMFERALAGDALGAERQRALLYLGKALHEDKQDARAVPLLLALAAEGTGSTFEASALHTLSHIQNPQHGHSH
jgi:tetratricopeptide (TPR) repeat protein